MGAGGFFFYNRACAKTIDDLSPIINMQKRKKKGAFGRLLDLKLVGPFGELKEMYSFPVEDFSTLFPFGARKNLLLHSHKAGDNYRLDS